MFIHVYCLLVYSLHLCSTVCTYIPNFVGGRKSWARVATANTERSSRTETSLLPTAAAASPVPMAVGSEPLLSREMQRLRSHERRWEREGETRFLVSHLSVVH